MEGDLAKDFKVGQKVQFEATGEALPFGTIITAIVLLDTENIYGGESTIIKTRILSPKKLKGAISHVPTKDTKIVK